MFTADYILLGIISDERAFRSLSPKMHNEALHFCGLQGSYVPLATQPGKLADAVAGLWAMGFTGANVTVPFKEEIIPFLESLSEEAKTIGAVNTLVRGARGFKGYNTDAIGFASTVEQVDARQSVAVIGTGGAARAVLAALKGKGCQQVYVLGRDKKKASLLAEQFAVKAISPLPESFNAHWFINTTPVSSIEENLHMAEWAIGLKPLSGVLDLNYGRPDSFWLTLAARHGAMFSDGLSMLAWQGKHAFLLWSGCDVPVTVFQSALS